MTKIYDSSSKHAVLSGGSKVINRGSFIVWAADAVDVLCDESSTSLDKATAVVGIVPGIGDAFSLADSIQHKDAEGIITSSVALAAFTDSQAIPVVGEVVDVALIAEAAVSALVTVISNYIQATQRPVITLPEAVSPVSGDGITLKWRSYADQRLTLPPNYGRKVQIFEISAEKGKSAPLHQLAGTFDRGYIDVEPERLIIIQDEKIATFHTKLELHEDPLTKRVASTYKSRPTSPVTISYGRPAYIRLSYTTKEGKDRPIFHPSVSCITGGTPSGTPFHNDYLISGATFLNLPFYIHGSSNYFSKISYFNQGGYVARLEILRGTHEIVTMYLAIGHTQVIDLTKYNIPEGATIRARIDVEFVIPKTPGPDIKYSSGSGETANLKSWGTVFSPQIDFG